jgi:hypothetical protein
MLSQRVAPIVRPREEESHGEPDDVGLSGLHCLPGSRDRSRQGSDRGGGNLVTLKREEWNVLVELIRSGELKKV